MATLLIATNSNGTKRRCDARCHDAKGSLCTCVCEGALHGIGHRDALAKIRARLKTSHWQTDSGWQCTVLPQQPELPFNSVGDGSTKEIHPFDLPNGNSITATRHPLKEAP